MGYEPSSLSDCPYHTLIFLLGVSHTPSNTVPNTVSNTYTQYPFQYRSNTPHPSLPYQSCSAYVLIMGDNAILWFKKVIRKSVNLNRLTAICGWEASYPMGHLAFIFLQSNRNRDVNGMP